MKIVYQFTKTETRIFVTMLSLLINKMGWETNTDTAQEKKEFKRHLVESCPGDFDAPGDTVSNYRKWFTKLCVSQGITNDDENFMDFVTAHRMAVSHSQARR